MFALTKTNATGTRFAIGSVERDTGIGRDTLRVWERRYGFPSPERNNKGERVYTADQVRRLQVIRRLLDQGLRPGRVVPLDDDSLGDLADALPVGSARDKGVDNEQAPLVALTAAGDVAGLVNALEQALARDGLRGFVLHTCAPLIQSVGEQWAGGRLAIFEEHLLTRQLTRFLDLAMSRLGRPAGAPRVLLTTLSGEQHALGLLMAEALLWCSGTPTLNLGTDVPMDQIVAAVERNAVSTVAISFSASYPRGPVGSHLEELVGRLPQGVSVWIGGDGVRRLRRLPASVVRKSLDSL